MIKKNPRNSFLQSIVVLLQVYKLLLASFNGSSWSVMSKFKSSLSSSPSFTPRPALSPPCLLLLLIYYGAGAPHALHRAPLCIWLRLCVCVCLCIETPLPSLSLAESIETASLPFSPEDKSTVMLMPMS